MNVYFHLVPTLPLSYDHFFASLWVRNSQQVIIGFALVNFIFFFKKLRNDQISSLLMFLTSLKFLETFILSCWPKVLSGIILFNSEEFL